jgi:hypothetical protein
MPKSTPAKLRYQKAYNARPENVNKREQNNAARREAIRKGEARVGDGKDVDHKKPLRKGGTNADSNTRVIDDSKNRGWRKGHRGKDSYDRR